MNLQTDLQQLTADQPLQPADRLAHVTGRARRLRRVRAAVSVAAVLAVAAPVAVVLSTPTSSTGGQFAGSPVTSWPDRSLAADRSVAEGALATFAAGEGDVTGARWLYRGQVGSTDEYVAVFLARKEGEQVVVTARTQLSRVDERGRGGQEDEQTFPWATYTAPVTTVTDQVSTFVNTSAGSTSSLAFPSEQVPDYRTTLFVLGDPQARQAHWSATALPFAPTDVTSEGDLTSAEGVFTSPALRLNGLPTVRVTDSRGRSGPVSTMGLGQDQPNLVLPDAVGFTTQKGIIGGSGSTQRPERGGAWTGAHHGYGVGQRGERVSAVVRCYGGGTLTLSMDADPAALSRTGTVPCDGQLQQALSSVPLPNADVSFTYRSDRLQVVTFAVTKG